ncbi:MAG: general secretion pathway protein GspK [Bdellovibrionales bacterium]|nr:general secretion pathway protein GspK [Oligoflexia bacterium]
MTYYQKLTDRFRAKLDSRGVALFIVLAAMATLAIFVGEITYTAQINQKLAYDRLDQVKAQSLAKSGLRIALLRIRAYTELKKTISKMSASTGASADMVNAVVPKAVLEKIWAEPITIPFSGDISSLPGSVKDALLKFRKDSGMEGRLYISVQAQSNKFNLNSSLPGFAAAPGATPTPKPGANPATAPAPAGTPVAFDATQARQLLGQQIKDMFQKKFEASEKFRDEYRNFRIEDLVEEILGWADLSYESPREQVSKLPFKKAPFYNISELHYLQSMDDEVYELLSDQFAAGVASFINVNKIREPVLKGLVPQITDAEAKKFFEFRDSSGQAAADAGAPVKNASSGEDNSFKSADEFYKYLKDKVEYFKGSDTRITDLKNGLTQRGIQLTTDESNFLVHIEATVQQTKRILEAMVSIVENATPPTVPGAPGVIAAPTPLQGGNIPGNPAAPADAGDKSNLKITQLRFL